ncbi:Neurochondrin-domain-containing protein [Fusarium avenaceum]|nr:Neurochondrin-domain-containing protein [Fusarium avenaceum]
MAETTNTPSTASQPADINKIQALLKAKDDTQRFVGLALLKSLLDSSEQLRKDEQTVQSLWSSLSPKFLDRLLRTGSKPSSKNSKEMLDLAVSVMHIFSILLPDKARSDTKLINRIPLLVSSVLHSSEDTTKLILQLLHTLVSSQQGAQEFVKVEDFSSLTEIAPSHAQVLDVLCFAWLNSMTDVEDPTVLSKQVDDTIKNLVSSFTGTDAVTLLEFLGYFLRHANSIILPRQPQWLKNVVTYIQNLVTSRPTPEARAAYTNATASVLQAFPTEGPKLIFTHDKKDDKAFSYLLINLILIDIRSSAPTLLEQLNKPEYPKVSTRLTSAFDVMSIFIGYLIQCLEDESLETFFMTPENLLSLRKGISDTMSLTAEYLRDRWDASVAGAMGLHPDARASTTETSTGTHHTLAWDSLKDNADDDMFILSAVRALSLWLREEENDILRKEATGLMDMFMDLYKSSSQDKLDFRSPVLVALEGLTALTKGRELFLANEGWTVLARDLNSILQHESRTSRQQDVSRATEIVRILLPIVEQETNGVPEAWMDLVTSVAAWDVSDSELSPPVQEALIAALQLCCAVLVETSEGMRTRYKHSITAIHGIAAQLDKQVRKGNDQREMLDDVFTTLASLTQER